MNSIEQLLKMNDHRRISFYHYVTEVNLAVIRTIQDENDWAMFELCDRIVKMIEHITKMCDHCLNLFDRMTKMNDRSLKLDEALTKMNACWRIWLEQMRNCVPEDEIELYH